MVSPLLASDSSTTRRVSTLLDPKTFFNRLYLKLLANRDCANITSADDLASLFQMVYQNKLGATLPKLTHLEHTAADIIAQDLINLRRWIESRNMHRLYLFAGKQATFEAWREVVEVSFWILAKSSTTPTLSLQPSSSVLSHLGDIGSLADQYLSSSNSFRGSGFHTLCLAVLNQLLTELCVTEHCPPSIRLLASGTLLHIASFLNSDDLAFDCGDNSSALSVKELAGQLTRIVYSLTELLLQTKPSSQRMRANLYGCLGYLLRFGRFMASQENRDSRGTSLILPECLSAMHSAANPSSHWARTNVAHLTELTDAFALHCLLVCDLIQSHAITQMAAFTFSELLITFDRSTRDLTSFLCQRTILQHLVDSTIEDLASVESFITSTASGFADENECVVDGTTNMSSAAISAFHLYRAKLSLLCRLATTTSGAKALILSGVINSLADRAIFSAFDVSNFYADTLDILCGTPERQHCKWLDFSSVLHTVTRLHSDINVLPDTAIFRKLLTSVTEKSREENEVHLSWSGVVLPTIALLKSILITLGPAHLCANQQVLNFLYTHSGSLITDETALGNTLSYFLNHSPDTISRRGFSCLTQWLAMEVCLTEVFVLISCTHIAGLDEFSALQREVVQSRIIRHVLCLLPAIFLDDPSVIGRSATEKPSPHRGTLGLEYLLCETQQVQLMHQLISVCVAAGGGSELTTVGSKSTKERVLGTLMGHLINVDAKDPLASMVLFMQALSWSLARLSRFEELCWCLSNLSLFEQSDAAESSEGLPKGEDRYTEKVSTHILHRRMPFKNGKLTTNELRQAYSIIFNGDSTTSAPATNSSGIDGYQRELSYLQANVSVGLCLIRVQLRFLATMCQKIAYIIWRYMDYYMNSVESPTKQTLTPVVPQSLSIRRLGSDSLAGALSTKSPRRTDLTDGQKAELKPDRSTIKQRLPSLLKPEVMTGLARLSEASYLNPNERLFIQVMKHRLERLVPRTTAEG
ncbi:unnamed protein product [Dicrocoelium dendriticum]|nr:unnamed protein product [Dicrocoelium dendriticum]